MYTFNGKLTPPPPPPPPPPQKKKEMIYSVINYTASKASRIKLFDVRYKKSIRLPQAVLTCMLLKPRISSAKAYQAGKHA